MRYFLLMCTLFLTACSGAGSDSQPNQPDDGALYDGSEFPVLVALNDPLLPEQWVLYNTGQAAYAQQGGLASADINAFSSARLQASSYARGLTGRGVKIAILDEDLEIWHEDLSANVLPNGSYNFNDKSFDPTTSDSYSIGHGTAVAGLAAARGGNGLGLVGVAPLAYLQGFNTLRTTNVRVELASLGDAATRQSYPGLKSHWTDVFNKSYGQSALYFNQPGTSAREVNEQLLAAIQVGTETLRGGKGAVYVKAGGNNYKSINNNATQCGEAQAHKVTCYNVNLEADNATPFQIVVGALNARAERSSYSSTGSALWISAPGGEPGGLFPAVMTTDRSGCLLGLSQTNPNKVTIKNSFNLGTAGAGNDGCHYVTYFAGTSAATPMISGTAALLLEAYPNANWRDVKHFLATTARKVQPNLVDKKISVDGGNVIIERGWQTNAAGYAFSNEFGFGGVNVLEAVDMALEWKQQRKNLPRLLEVNSAKQVLTEFNEVPDFKATGLQKTLNFNQSLTIETLALTLSLEGLSDNPAGLSNAINVSDYVIELISPAGTKSILMTPFTAYRSGYDMPQATLVSHAFYGETLAGNWTLRIVDVAKRPAGQLASQGKLTEWSLTAYGH